MTNGIEKKPYRKPMPPTEEEIVMGETPSILDKPVEEPKQTMEVVEEVAEVVAKGPKRYVCRVKCWVSGKRGIVEVGEVIEFDEGETIPSHFQQI
jgi:hypothetical protein